MKIPKYTRAGFINVYKDGKKISEHKQEQEAIESAGREKLLAPNSVVVFKGEYTTTVALDTVPDPVTPIPIPVPAPTPVPIPAPIPPPVIQPGDKLISIPYNDPISGSTLIYAVKGDQILFVSPIGTGLGTQDSPLHPSKIFALAKKGTIFVFRGGEYRENYGGNWGNGNFAFGKAQSGIALVGMSGEVAKLSAPSNDETCITLANGDAIDVSDSIANDPTGNPNQPSAADNVTIAGFYFAAGSQAIDGGGYWERQESGARGIVIVGNDITATYTGNTMTGVITMQGDGCKILGNKLHDFGTSPSINNNHAIYMQTGPDNCEIGYNRIKNLKIGHVIQFHNDGTKRQVDKAWVHHNYLKGANAIDMRGINYGDVGALSTSVNEFNVLEDLGQGFSAFAAYCGDHKLYNNKFINISGGNSGKVWTGTAGAPCNPPPVIREKGNTFTGGTGPNWSGNIVHE